MTETAPSTRYDPSAEDPRIVGALAARTRLDEAMRDGDRAGQMLRHRIGTRPGEDGALGDERGEMGGRRSRGRNGLDTVGGVERAV